LHDVFGDEIGVRTGCNLDMVAMEHLGDGGEMACEVALGALGHTAAAPGDHDIFRKARVWVLDSDKSKLDAAFAEVLDELGEFAV
jgi:hypothetical protein